MTSLEDTTQAFIIRIWRESREAAGAPPEWRGVIQHVASGDRRFFRDLDDVTGFLAAYLTDMGYPPAPR